MGTRLNRLWLNFKVNCQKNYLVLKKGWRNLTRNAKPFLIPKYWFMYVLSFCVGLYLYGPARGVEQIKKINLMNISQKRQTSSIETLQRELDLLKKDLRQIKKETDQLPEPAFNPQTFSRPVIGEVVKGFEWIFSDNAWRLHTGVDILVLPESNIMAAAGGMVTEVYELSDGSAGVTINHGNGWESVYTNLSRVLVHKGQKVIKGVVIGISGNTGCATPEPSFHFAIYHDKQPVDPAKLINSLSQ